MLEGAEGAGGEGEEGCSGEEEEIHGGFFFCDKWLFVFVFVVAVLRWWWRGMV